MDREDFEVLAPVARALMGLHGRNGRHLHNPFRQPPLNARSRHAVAFTGISWLNELQALVAERARPVLPWSRARSVDAQKPAQIVDVAYFLGQVFSQIRQEGLATSEGPVMPTALQLADQLAVLWRIELVPHAIARLQHAATASDGDALNALRFGELVLGWLDDASPFDLIEESIELLSEARSQVAALLMGLPDQDGESAVVDQLRRISRTCEARIAA